MSYLSILKSFAILGLLCSVVTGQNVPPSPQWSITQPSDSVIVTVLGANGDGSFITNSGPYFTHIYTGKNYLTKHDATGAQVWQREFQGQFIRGGFVDDDGNTYVTGNFYAQPSVYRSWIGKFAPDGTTLWINSAAHIPHTSNQGLVRDSAGYFYSTGTTFEIMEDGSFGDRQISLRKWSPTGESLWLKEYGAEIDEYGNGLQIDGSGNIYLLGSAEGISSQGDTIEYASLALKKIDSDGNVLWETEIAPSGVDKEIYGGGFVVDEAGNIFIGAHTDGLLGESSFGAKDGFVGRWNTNGNPVWGKQFGTSKYDSVMSLELGKNGTLLVTGYSDSFNSIEGGTSYISQLNYDGTENWSFERTLFNTRKDITGLTSNYMGDLIATSHGGSFISQGFIELFAFPKSADFDGDGDIDGRDFLAWQRGVGTVGATLSDGDANADSLVNEEDLAIWHNQYGNSNALGANVAVPEPNAAVLSVFGLLFAALVKQGRPAIR